MTRRGIIKLTAGLAVLVLVTAACTSGGKKALPNPTVSATAGGTYRTAIESFFTTDGMDPTGEYTTTMAELGGEMLIRNLVTWAHVAGQAGDVLYPDLATAMPSVSPDGLTYTFHLKSGIKFGPPVNREITSHDIEYAFERINTKALTALYGFYYFGTIVGMDGTATSPKPISGIDTPNDKTIVFHLTRPTGDFVDRLTMSATGPIPKEVAGCFNKPAYYGRYLISSGPYMYKGEGALDIKSCSTMKPISGFDPNKGMLLVRNPNYAPSTDSKTVRENLLDGVDIAVDSNTADIFNKIEQGSLDGIWQGTHVPATFVQRVQSGAAPNVTLHDNPDDGIYYFSMNLLTPPFDDVHVRKAVNWAMDKAQLQKVVGGPLHGAIATHIFPPSVLSYPGYNPYPTPGSAGDVSKAQAEMKLSKYDPKHDGMCDVPACKNVFMLSCSDSPDCAAQEPVIQASLAKIGITFRVRELTSSAAYNLAQGVKNLVPFYVSGGWVKDYPDPFTYIVLFQSSSIICTGASNYSNIGMTAAQAKQCGVTSEWQKAKPTSLDANITHCARLSSSARADCWRAFDRTVMQDVVPWVPWRWSNTITPTYKTVTKFEFDQNAALPSFVHIAVNNGVDPNTLSL